MGKNKGWIAVDLDATLVTYDGWKGPEHIGEPIPLMMNRVRQWLKEGKEVRIFTARVSHDGSETEIQVAHRARVAIENFTLQEFGQKLVVTNVKDFAMIEHWDDRVVQVIPNTGVRADGAD